MYFSISPVQRSTLAKPETFGQGSAIARNANRVFLPNRFRLTIPISKFTSSSSNARRVASRVLRFILISVKTLLKLSSLSLKIESAGDIHDPITTTSSVSGDSHAFQRWKQNVSGEFTQITSEASVASFGIIPNRETFSPSKITGEFPAIISPSLNTTC
ncbi:hypothetical protein YC2023_086950 [Brassica napus]